MTKTITRQIWEYLRDEGPLNKKDAHEKFGTNRLPSIITNLKSSHKVPIIAIETIPIRGSRKRTSYYLGIEPTDSNYEALIKSVDESLH